MRESTSLKVVGIFNILNDGLGNGTANGGSGSEPPGLAALREATETARKGFQTATPAIPCTGERFARGMTITAKVLLGTAVAVGIAAIFTLTSLPFIGLFVTFGMWDGLIFIIAGGVIGAAAGAIGIAALPFVVTAFLANWSVERKKKLLREELAQFAQKIEDSQREPVIQAGAGTARERMDRLFAEKGILTEAEALLKRWIAADKETIYANYVAAMTDETRGAIHPEDAEGFKAAMEAPCLRVVAILHTLNAGLGNGTDTGWTRWRAPDFATVLNGATQAARAGGRT
jgi:hypothetical protein